MWCNMGLQKYLTSRIRSSQTRKYTKVKAKLISGLGFKHCNTNTIIGSKHQPQSNIKIFPTCSKSIATRDVRVYCK